MMKSFGLLALAASAKLVSGHATIFAAWINDVDQGLGNTAGGYIRAPPNNSPIVDVTSKDMICNVNNAPVAKTLEVAAGDKFSFEWHHNTRDSSDDIIDPSHRGPVLVYIAPTTEGTAGNGWVKIYEDGFDGSSWAVDKLRAARGIHSITIPDIAAGDYLLRAEIIALHEGDRLNGAQFYPGCVQIKITSSGSTTLPAGSTIPGIYKATDPGVLFDLYNGFTSYPIPGPALWDGVSGGSSSAPAPTSTAEPTTTSAAAPAPTTAVPTAPASSVPTTLQTSVRSSTTSVPTAVPTTPTTTPPSSSGSVAVWYQCGGINYVGATTCESGLVCKDWNPYYYQCIPA